MMWANFKRPRSPEVQCSPVVVKASHKRPWRSTLHSTLFGDQFFVSFSQPQRRAQINTVHKSVTPKVKSKMRKQVGRPRKRSKYSCPWANEFFLMIYPWLFLFSKKLHAWKYPRSLLLRFSLKLLWGRSWTLRAHQEGSWELSIPKHLRRKRLQFQIPSIVSHRASKYRDYNLLTGLKLPCSHYNITHEPHDHTSSKTRVAFFYTTMIM